MPRALKGCINRVAQTALISYVNCISETGPSSSPDHSDLETAGTGPTLPLDSATAALGGRPCQGVGLGHQASRSSWWCRWHSGRAPFTEPGPGLVLTMVLGLPQATHAHRVPGTSTTSSSGLLVLLLRWKTPHKHRREPGPSPVTENHLRGAGECLSSTAEPQNKYESKNCLPSP